ncbi:MAG: tyrosine-type recombinase/integrase, partial [Methanobacteriaceae archaeon]
GLKETSISNYLIYVKAFYSTFEIELPKLPIKLNSLPKKNYKEWISKEDIKKALKYSNQKYKAIILLMGSSGMGSSEIRNLTFKDFLKSLEEYIRISLKEPYKVENIRNSLPINQNIIPTWHIQRVKTGEYYYTFSSPESLEAILNYIEYREAKDKPIIGLDEPLFIGRRPGDLLNKYTMTSAFQKINDDAGFETLGNKRYFTSHELRRFFSLQSFRAGLRERDVKWLRGQKPRNMMNRYVKPDPQNLKIEYMEKALPCLSMENVKIRELEEDIYRRLRDLEKENQDLKIALRKEQKITGDKVEKLEAMVTAMLEKQLTTEEHRSKEN